MLSHLSFVTLAAATEYPNQWHELSLAPCAATLVQRDLRLAPPLRAEAEALDSRPGRNRIKRGRALEELLVEGEAAAAENGTITLQILGCEAGGFG